MTSYQSSPGGGVATVDNRNNPRLAEVRSQVSDVQNIMRDNIDRVMERGERLDDLMDRAEDMYSQSQQFSQTSRKVRRKMWWENCRMKIILGIIITIILVAVVLVILFSIGVLPPKGGSHTNPTTTAVPPTTIAPNRTG